MVENRVVRQSTPLDPFLAEDEGTVRTASHLCKWRLTMNGYHVVSTGIIPREAPFGRVHYTRVWDLAPPKQT